VEFIRNLRIRKKILLLVLAAMTGIVLTAFIGIIHMKSMDANTKAMYKDRLLPVKWVNEILTYTRLTESNLLEYILTQDELMKANMLKQNQSIDSTIIIYEDRASDQTEIDLLLQYKDILPHYRNALNQVIALVDASKNAEAYDSYVNQVGIPGNQINKILTDLSGYNEQIAERLYEDNKQEAQSAFIISIVAAAAVLALILWAGQTVNQLITKPLGSLQNQMRKAEAGDLSAFGHYPFRDELGSITDSYNAMLSGLRRLVEQASESAVTISASSEELLASTEHGAMASEQIAASSQHLASELDKQNKSLHEASSEIAGIAQNIALISEDSEVVFRSVTSSINASKSGAASVLSVSEQMQSIHAKVTEIHAIVQLLATHMKEINAFVEVIHGISAQTHVLSLNAAIEAARVGAAGQGFSVVAGEIRKLAGTATSSSRSISELIGNLQAEVKRMHRSMQEGLYETEQGMEKTKHVQLAFRDIDAAVENVHQSAAGIKMKIEQLGTGSQKIVSMMDVVDRVANEGMAIGQQTSASCEEQLSSMEEIRHSSEALARLAEELQESLQKFRL